jgi:hypothetical protein
MAGRLMLDFRDVNETNFEEKASKLLEQIHLMHNNQTKPPSVSQSNNSQAPIIQGPAESQCLFETRIRMFFITL